MACVVPSMDMPEDGLDDFEFAKYLEDSRQRRRSRTLPAAVTSCASNLMGKVLSTCSRSTTSPSDEFSDDGCVVGYIETAYSLRSSVSNEVQHISTGDDGDELRDLDNDGDYTVMRSILTGGDADGWYRVSPASPSPMPSQAVCLRTVPVSTQTLPQSSSVPAIVHAASMRQSNTLNSGYIATITPVGTASGVTRRIAAPEAGERRVALVSDRTPLRLAETLVDAQVNAKDEDKLENATKKTTLMLCNLPHHYSRNSVMDLLRSEGFAHHVTFVYMPMNLRSQGHFGYAFVDFDSVSVTEECRNHMEGFTRWSEASDKVISVGWSDTQGLDAHIERYRNSPLMHESVDDELKPALFEHGVRIGFPKATQKIRAPRLRRTSDDRSRTERSRAMTA